MLVESAREFLLELEVDAELRCIVDRTEWEPREVLAIAADFGYLIDEESLYRAYDELYATALLAG